MEYQLQKKTRKDLWAKWDITGWLNDEEELLRVEHQELYILCSILNRNMYGIWKIINRYSRSLVQEDESYLDVTEKVYWIQLNSLLDPSYYGNYYSVWDPKDLALPRTQYTEKREDRRETAKR